MVIQFGFNLSLPLNKRKGIESPLFPLSVKTMSLFQQIASGSDLESDFHSDSGDSVVSEGPFLNCAEWELRVARTS